MRFICDYLVEIGKEHEKNNRFNEAEELHKMVVRIAEQREHDNFFLVHEMGKLDDEQYGLEHLNELYEKTKELDKKHEVMKKIEEAENRIDYLFSLRQRSTQISPEAYAEEVVERGQLAVLESLPPK